jgi:hypothetical protein
VPDWARRLREQLVGMRLGAEQEEEVIVELSGHLEDTYENLVGRSICAEKAEEQAWREVSGGRELAHEINRAKVGGESMNEHAKQVWFPGMVMAALAISLLGIFQHAGMQPTGRTLLENFSHIVPRIPAGSPVVLYFYLPWLVMLPIFGFAGAYWSKRAGGGTRARMFAGVFPALITLIVPFLLVPVALVVGDRHGPNIVALGWFLFNWGILPATALLIGTVPVAGAFNARRGDGTETRSTA